MNQTNSMIITIEEKIKELSNKSKLICKDDQKINLKEYYETNGEYPWTI